MKMTLFFSEVVNLYKENTMAQNTRFRFKQLIWTWTPTFSDDWQWRSGSMRAKSLEMVGFKTEGWGEVGEKWVENRRNVNMIQGMSQSMGEGPV